MEKRSWFTITLCCVLISVLSVCAVAAEQELIVSAAASLTYAFGDIGKQFEREHPGTKVLFNFAASGALVQQIERGAPVDVFASADQKTMERARENNLILTDTLKNFSSNELVLIVPRDIKLPPESLKDLTLSRVDKISLGNPQSVPAGRYTEEALTNEGLWESLSPKFIYGDSVRQVLDYVSRGEVDAGFVFSTDAMIAGDRARIAATIDKHKPILYPAAVVSGAQEIDLARSFVEFLLSAEGQEILSHYGFKKP